MNCIAVMLLVTAAAVSLAFEPPGIVWDWEYMIEPNPYAEMYQVDPLSNGCFASAGVLYDGCHVAIYLDADGEMLWGWNGSSAGISSVRWVEEYRGDILVTGSYGSTSAFFAKLSLNGSTIWDREYAADDTRGRCIATLPDGMLLMGGRRSSPFSYIPLIYKTDSLGNLRLTKEFGDYSGTVTRLLVDDDRIVALVDLLNAGCAVIAMDMGFNILWEQDYSGVLPDGDCDICLPRSGPGYMLVAGDTQAFLNESGTVLWQRQPPGSHNRSLRSVSSTMDGGFVMCGVTGMYYLDSLDYHPYNGWLVRTDSAGEVLWCMVDSTGLGHTYYNCVRQLPEGGYVVCGKRATSETTYWARITRFTPETGIEEGEILQTPSLDLSPNPFSTSLEISYSLTVQEPIKLSVYDLSGRQVGVLENGIVPEGEYTSVWDAGELPSGCYIVMLRAGETTTTETCVLAR